MHINSGHLLSGFVVGSVHKRVPFHREDSHHVVRSPPHPYALRVLANQHSQHSRSAGPEIDSRAEEFVVLVPSCFDTIGANHAPDGDTIVRCYRYTIAIDINQLA
jgi:hypothetical protein